MELNLIESTFIMNSPIIAAIMSKPADFPERRRCSHDQNYLDGGDEDSKTKERLLSLKSELINRYTSDQRSLQIILRRQHSAGTLDVLIEGSFLNELYKILHYEYYGEHLIMKCSLEVTSILDGLKYLCSAGLSQLVTEEVQLPFSALPPATATTTVPKFYAENIKLESPAMGMAEMWECDFVVWIEIDKLDIAGVHSLLPVSNEVARKMLEEQLFCDVEVVADGGKHFPCHKSFLAAQSPVFHAMLSHDFEERKTSVISLVDMSDEAVDAFLKFIYYSHVKIPTQNCGIAVELYIAGHKYIINSLKQVMKLILMDRKEVWYDFDSIARLLLFLKHLNGEDENELKQEIGRNLERFGKSKILDIENDEILFLNRSIQD